MEGKEFIILTQCTPKSGSTEPEDAFYPKECVSKVSGQAVMAVSDGVTPKWSQMLVARAVWALPEKTTTSRMGSA